MRTYKYLALVAMALIFAACEKDVITPSAQIDTDAVRVKASINGIKTRLNVATDGQTTFESGDMILVENLSRSTENVATYCMDGSSNWNVSAGTLKWNTGTNDFRAVYPSTAAFDAFVIPVDQKSLNKIVATDWMLAQADGLEKPEDKVLQLDFKHQLSMVTVEVGNVGTEYNAPVYKPESGKFYPNATASENSHITFEDTYVSAFMNGASNPISDKKATWQAILRPGKYAAGSYFMSIGIAGVSDELMVKAPDFMVNDGLKAGNHYKMKLNVGYDFIEVVGVTVEPWTDVNMGEKVALGAISLDGVAATGFEEGSVLTLAAQVNGSVSWVDYTYVSGKWQTASPLVVDDVNSITDIKAWVGFPGTVLSRSAAISSNDFLTDAVNGVCDQSSALVPFDWMISKTAISVPTKSNPVIDINFSHAFAKVTLTAINFSTDFDVTPTLTDINFVSRPCLSYDVASSTFSTGAQNGVDYAIVKPYFSASEYSALVVPNSSEGVAETTLMTLKVNGIEKSVKLASPLEPGKHYTFKLNVTASDAVLVPVNASLGWNDEVEL